MSTWLDGQVLYVRDPDTGEPLPVSGTANGDGTASIDTAGGVGGGGGAITVADAADVAQGAKGDAAYAGSGDATVISGLKGLYTKLGAVVLAAGSALIGKIQIRNAANNADIDPLAETTYTGRVGEVQASPTQYTILDRLKTVATNVANIASFTFTTVGSNAHLNAVIPNLTSTLDSVTAVGDIAHGSADSGNPLKIGGKARTANPAAVTNGQRVDGFFDKVGRPVIVIGQARELRGQTYTSIANTNETTIIAASGSAGVYRDLRGILIANDSTTDVRVDVRDNTGGSVLQSYAVKAGTTSGAMVVQSVPQTTANVAWTAQLSTTPSGGGAAVKITAFWETNV